MVATRRTRIGPEVIFDGDGNALRIQRRDLSRRLGLEASGRDPVDYAIRQLGFVRLLPMRSALIVEFQPATASDLAMIAAFYEISERVPGRILLVCRGDPDRFEIFPGVGPALQRIETLIKRNP
jgi:hypothetical protein